MMMMMIWLVHLDRIAVRMCVQHCSSLASQPRRALIKKGLARETNIVGFHTGPQKENYVRNKNTSSNLPVHLSSGFCSVLSQLLALGSAYAQ